MRNCRSYSGVELRRGELARRGSYQQLQEAKVRSPNRKRKRARTNNAAAGQLKEVIISQCLNVLGSAYSWG